MRSAPVPQRDAVGGGGTRQPGRPGSPRRCSINEATARPASVFIKHLGRQMWRAASRRIKNDFPSGRPKLEKTRGSFLFHFTPPTPTPPPPSAPQHRHLPTTETQREWSASEADQQQPACFREICVCVYVCVFVYMLCLWSLGLQRAVSRFTPVFYGSGNPWSSHRWKNKGVCVLVCVCVCSLNNTQEVSSAPQWPPKGPLILLWGPENFPRCILLIYETVWHNSNNKTFVRWDVYSQCHVSTSNPS